MLFQFLASLETFPRCGDLDAKLLNVETRIEILGYCDQP